MLTKSGAALAIVRTGLMLLRKLATKSGFLAKRAKASLQAFGLVICSTDTITSTRSDYEGLSILLFVMTLSLAFN
jgi:hypothetical protein